VNILYVLNSDKPGGMERHVRDLVKGMVSKKHKVYVWCLEGMIAEWYREDGAEIYTEHAIGFEVDRNYIKALVEFLKKKKISVVHAHELKAVANSLLAGFMAGTPVRISHTHTPISEWQTRNPFEKIWWIPTYLGYALEVNLFATREIALTRTKENRKIQEGILRKKLEIIPNGLDTRDFEVSDKKRTEFRNEFRKKYKVSEEAVVFGNIGRLSEEKGIPTLVKGFAEFLRFPTVAQKDSYLVLAGGGALEKELRDLVKKLKIEDKVIFAGVFEDEDKVKYLSMFDCFVFPTLAEGFGLVLVEAMYFGVPVLCSDLAVLEEVGAETVTYFEKSNHADLANKMETFATNDVDGSTAIVERARERVVENYTLEKFTENYHELYKRLLKDKRKKEDEEE
jgi:glycosyltransferase involved in cell wall biosynthesis